MNLERRLQHAARELREVTIDVPPLGQPVRRHRASLIPALAAPLLFAAGALFAGGAARGVERPMQSDISVTADLVVDPVASSVANPVVEFVPTIVEPTVTVVADSATRADAAAPTIHEELEMISRFVAQSQTSRATDVTDPEPQPTDPVAIGPI